MEQLSVDLNEVVVNLANKLSIANLQIAQLEVAIKQMQESEKDSNGDN